MIRRLIWHWRHWVVRAGPYRFGRWCAGAPCALVGNQGHPLEGYKVRRY